MVSNEERAARPGHQYTVEFRIYGGSVDPAVITAELGLEPCQSRRPGEFGLGEQADVGMWAYNGYGQNDSPFWGTLNEGLAFVLKRLWPHRQTIASYRSTADCVWWCGHFQSSFDGGPTLSPSLLSRLAEFGAELFIDNYFSEEPDRSAAAAD